MPRFWREAAAAKAAADAVEQLVLGQEAGAEGVAALLSTLDSGEALVLEHVADDKLRGLLRKLCEVLELERLEMPDGTTAHTKGIGQPPFLEAFAHLLEGAQEASCAAAPARQLRHGAQKEGFNESDAGTQRPSPAGDSVPATVKRVIGPTMPPPANRPPGEALEKETPAEKAAEAAVDDDEADDNFGPKPIPVELSEALIAATVPQPWWKRSAEAPKAPEGMRTAIPAAPQQREEWMTALPSDRHGLIGGPGAPRQFARDSDAVFSGTPDASWTAAPQGAGHTVEPLDGAPLRPMSLSEAAKLARANAASGRRPQPPTSRVAASLGEVSEGALVAKSLVAVHAELQANEKKATKGKAEWEGAHPWRPWNRDTDLDIRAAKPKGIDSILKNQHMGELGSRFGGGGRETTFM